jgi:UDP-N-acetylmuramoyl-tripeptide--D-alanyl-D-alanine ligase
VKFSIADAVTVTGGEQYGPNLDVSGVAVDSRAVRGGQLFVPLRATRDGHDWIPAALAAGAAAYLTERQPEGGTAVRVGGTRDALYALASFARDRTGGTVIGVTGSVGKTTTKDMIRAVLGTTYQTHASARSYNNEIGVPVTLLNAPDDAEMLVLEMGARAPRDIAALCELARPSIGVVTRVAPVHTEVFGGIDGVERAKRELVEALPASGHAILNADDRRVAAMARATSAEVLTFGSSGDVCGEVLAIDDDLRPTVRLRTPSDVFEVRLSARGFHQVMNAAAATAVGFACDVAAERIGQALEQAELSPLRMSLSVSDRGARILDDTYNASPVSVEAALRSLAALTAARRVAVLGVMAELGPSEGDEHRRIARLAESLGIEVVAVAAPQYGVPCVEADSVIDHLGGLIDGDAILVKGSRVAGMERVASMLRTAGETS